MDNKKGMEKCESVGGFELVREKKFVNNFPVIIFFMILLQTFLFDCSTATGFPKR